MIFDVRDFYVRLTVRVRNILMYDSHLSQILYFVVIDSRFVKDKRKDFVDLCSVSNISVFIWVHKRYGFYIYGRSPNRRAEVNMKEINNLLQRKED